jgi:hypothetical protein
MKRFIIMALMLVATQAGAIDFSSNTTRELGFKEKREGLTIGTNTRNGFRWEASATKDTRSELGATLGIRGGVPLLTGDKLSVKLLGGVALDPLKLDAAVYRVGLQFEYKAEDKKSFVVLVNNSFDPRTQTFGASPQLTFGARFYF